MLCILLEQQLTGNDLRIQALDGKLLAACVREPAYVVGDGQHDIHTLIRERNTFIATQNPQNRIELDDDTRGMLQAQALSLNSIPANEQKVVLKKVANISQGGVPVDVTDLIHPRYAEWIETLARRLDLQHFAMDVMTSDFSLDPNANAMALEVNDRPMWLQHTFSDRRKHDMPNLILKSLFGIT